MAAYVTMPTSLTNMFRTADWFGF